MASCDLIGFFRFRKARFFYSKIHFESIVFKSRLFSSFIVLAHGKSNLSWGLNLRLCYLHLSLIIRLYPGGCSGRPCRPGTWGEYKTPDT